MGHRVTVKNLASGQPRPYADSRSIVQVLFETEDYQNLGTYKPWDLTEERVRERLKGLVCGFTEFRYPQDCKDPAKPTASEYFTTRLDYLKKVSPGLWEFKTTSAFTD